MSYNTKEIVIILTRSVHPKPPDHLPERSILHQLQGLSRCVTHVCHGRSGESRRWVADHRHVSIAAYHLLPWCRFEGSDWMVECVGVWQD